MRNVNGRQAVDGTLEALSHLSEVEDFFAFFRIEPEPRVLERHRVALLRAWAREVARIDECTRPEDEAARLALYREALVDVHEAFARGRGHLRLVKALTGCAACALSRP